MSVYTYRDKILSNYGFKNRQRDFIQNNPDYDIKIVFAVLDDYIANEPYVVEKVWEKIRLSLSTWLSQTGRSKV